MVFFPAGLAFLKENIQHLNTMYAVAIGKY